MSNPVLRRIYAHLRAAWRWKRKESELDEELQFHLAEETEERTAAGLNPHEARQAAHRDFGNPLLVRENTRDAWGWASFERVVQDVRYGLRTMRRNPVFASAAILSLALGIGANTAVFSLMDAVLFRMLPVKSPEELVVFAHRGDGEPSTGSNYPLYETLRDESQSYAGLLAFWQLSFKLRVGNEIVSTEGQYVTPHYFSVLGVHPILGRVFSDVDFEESVVVISHRLWTRSFGGSPDVLGKVVAVNGVPVTVIGVHPPEFFGLQPGASADLSIPFGLQKRISPEAGNRLTMRGGIWALRIVGRLRPGVSRESARAEAEVLVRPWVQDVVQRGSGSLGSWARIELLSGSSGLDALRRQFSKPLQVLMAVVAIVLLTGCANIANLLLARAASRRKEIAVRASIGAGRGRLIRQLMTESILLATIGGVAGFFVAIWSARLLVGYISTGPRPVVLNVEPDLRLLAFTALVALVTGILFGILPALRATSLDLTPSLKEHAGSRGSNAGGGRLRKLLVAAQVGLSLLLLIGASLFVRSLANIRGLDPGFKYRPAPDRELRSIGYGLPERTPVCLL